MQVTSRYLEVIDDLKKTICEKGYQEGDKLEPELELCKRYNVSRMTMRRSIEALVTEGILIRQRPKGTFIAKVPEKQETPSHETEFYIPSLLKAKKITLKLEALDKAPHQLKFWQEIFDLFRQKHPLVSIELNHSPYLHEVKGTEQLSDIMLLPAWSIPHYKQLNLLRPLTNKPDLAENHTGFEGSEHYAVPFSIGMGFLACNYNLLDKATVPTTSNLSFKTFAQTLEKASNELSSCCLLKISSSFPAYICCGAELDDIKGQQKIPEKVLEIWHLFYNLSQKNKQFIDVSRNTLSIPTLFSSCCTNTLQNIKSTTKEELNFYSKPLTQNSIQRYLPLSLAVSAYTPYPELSEAFAQFIGSKLVQQKISEMNYAIPAKKEMPIKDPDAATIASILPESKPFSIQSSRVPEYMETVFMPISADVMHGNTPPEQGVKLLKNATEQFHNNQLGWDIIKPEF